MARLTLDATASGRGRAHYAWVLEDGVPILPIRLDEDRSVTGHRTPDSEWQYRVRKAQELVDAWNATADGDRG